MFECIGAELGWNLAFVLGTAMLVPFFTYGYLFLNRQMKDRELALVRLVLFAILAVLGIFLIILSREVVNDSCEEEESEEVEHLES